MQPWAQQNNFRWGQDREVLDVFPRGDAEQLQAGADGRNKSINNRIT